MAIPIQVYVMNDKGGGNYKAEDISGKIGETFGFNFRLYFGSMVKEVALQPFVKFAYNVTLGNYYTNTKVEAVKVMNSSDGANIVPNNLYLTNGSWNLNLVAALGLTANSDIVSLYLEPSLGLKVEQVGNTDKNAKETYGLGYDVYLEIHITPLKNLEWYFEANIGNTTGSLAFAGTTGITWYLPALQ